jgi:hypothetical protein
LERWLENKSRRSHLAGRGDADEMNGKSRLARLRSLLDRSKRLTDAAAALEDRVLSAYHADMPLDKDLAAAELAEGQADFRNLCPELYATSLREPDVATLAVYGEMGNLAADLASMYDALARQHGFSTSLYQIALRAPADKAGSRAIVFPGSDTLQATLISSAANRAEESLRRLQDASIGFAIEIRGRLCYPLFAREEGCHLYRHKAETARALVHVSNTAIGAYNPPPRIERRDGMKNQPTRRQYDEVQSRIEDALLKISPYWSDGDLAGAVGPLLDAQLQAEIEAWLAS